MIFLIGQISTFLLLTAGFAAVAGWMYAAHRAAPARRALLAQRDRLLRDLALLAAGEGVEDNSQNERAAEAGESIARIREGRIAELERALEGARGRADEAVAEAAELRRTMERETSDGAELARLRAFAVEHEERRPREIEAAVLEAAADADADDSALQGWRLRYFEQRVRYLEEQARLPAPVAPEMASGSAATPALEWRAREAEARAAHLEQELRLLSGPADTAEAAPFAADADVDALLRWRLLYLERRVANLQEQRAPRDVAPMTAAVEAAPDPDRWKWRARYLEARVRHLEQRPAAAGPTAAPVAAAAAPANAPHPAEPERIAPSRPGVKPPILASARTGAPDDLTLIEGVSQLQQIALYSLGVFHFDQIAAWTADHAAWVDQYFRLRGRIEEEEWVEQASELAREGPAARRLAEEEALSP